MAPGASGDFGGQRRDVAVAAALLPSPSCWGHTLRSPLINLQSYFQTTFSTTFSPERVPPQTTSSGDLEALPPIEQLFMQHDIAEWLHKELWLQRVLVLNLCLPLISYAVLSNFTLLRSQFVLCKMGSKDNYTFSLDFLGEVSQAQHTRPICSTWKCSLIVYVLGLSHWLSLALLLNTLM